MRVAMEAAKFTPGRGRRPAPGHGGLPPARRRWVLLKERMVGRMVGRGYDPALADRCFRQIEGFGDYGFPGVPRRQLRPAGLRLPHG